jgi:hypothetical protein
MTVDCFPTPLKLQYVGFRTFEIVEPFTYQGKNLCVTVPAGTTTDFASIPKVFHVVLDPFGQYARAAVVHDFLYRTQYYDRAIADGVLLEGMRRSGVPIWQYVSIYLSVRAFGWLSYYDCPKRKLRKLMKLVLITAIILALWALVAYLACGWMF